MMDKSRSREEETGVEGETVWQRDDQGCRSAGEERFIKMSGGVILGPRGVVRLSRTVAQMFQAGE
jgi:hypothetical protein